MHGNVENMKRELESIKGFSTVELFNLLDTHKKKYLDAIRIWDFIFMMAGPQK